MAKAVNTENEDFVVGIDNAPNPMVSEEDFVAGLLEAASFKEEEDSKKEIEIVRNGKKLFSFTIRPISTDEFYLAKKNGSKFVKNPLNKKLPKIEDEAQFNTAVFHSWLIYTATVDADKEKVWNNQAIKSKYNLMLPVDSVPVLLRMGEMNKIVDAIMEISGIGEEEETTIEETVKN